MKCDVCSGKGEIKGIGGIVQKCDACKYKRKCATMLDEIKSWFSHPFKTTPVAIPTVLFVFLILGICFRYYYSRSLSDPLEITLITSSITMFGAIFVGLKYKLDQASYHRSLFEERYAIFLKIDGILSASFQGEDKDGKKMGWRDFSKELDSFL